MAWFRDGLVKQWHGLVTADRQTDIVGPNYWQ